MTQVTGALAMIRQRVEQQKINEIERKVRRQQAEECLERALTKLSTVMREFENAQKEWALTPREQKIWAKKIATQTGNVAAARNRLEQLP